MNLARLISFWTGFCSLSLEIAWVRLYGYANQSTPKAFAYVLAVYLLGIAAGAQIGKKICKSQERGQIERASIIALALSASIAAIAPWIFLHSQQLALDALAAPLAIFITAASLSILFPITHHLGTPPSANQRKKGGYFSRVYTMNVIGAALGPLVTGYILLEHLTITQIFPILAAIIALLTVAVWLLHDQPKKNQSNILSFTLACCLVTAIFMHIAWKNPRAFIKEFAIVDGLDIVAVHEGRHGIITITEKPISKEQAFIDYTVYGGNVYDGKVNVDLERNTNGLERPLVMHVLQPNAKRVLILGLSIGSWLTVVEGFPGVEQIDVVEINPGYLDLAKNFDIQRRALEDPRVNLIIDDARRWLQYHPEKKYDLILMNTTWHWRANSSMILSQQMMRLIAHHLADHGVMAFNATGSPDAFYTASTVFREVRRYQNFIYGADWDPFSRTEGSEAWEVLKNVMIDKKPGFSPDSQNIRLYSKIPFIRLQEDMDRLNRAPEVITDDNMLVEYKYGRRL